MPTRLVASDIDGTFLRHDGTPHPRVLETLGMVRRAGIEVAFVTGRPPRWMSAVVEASGHRGLAVCGNGAILLDLHDEVVIDVDAIPVDRAAEAIQRLRKLDPGVGIALDRSRVGERLEDTLTGAWFTREERYRTPWEDPGGSTVDDILTALHEGPITKLLAAPSLEFIHQDADLWLSATSEVLAGVVEVTHSNSAQALLEMSADGVTKASGLAKIADRIGATQDEVMAVGDMPNDLPMLLWAGRSYAMANAHPTVLAAVHKHVASNDEGGVAEVFLDALAS